MPTITATSRLSGGPLRCAIDLDGGHRVHTGEPADQGGDASAPTPRQLLAASLASCITTTMRMYATRKGWEVGEARVDVDFDHEARPPRFHVAVHLDERLSEEQRERMLFIAGRCPVSRLIESGAEIVHAAA